MSDKNNKKEWIEFYATSEFDNEELERLSYEECEELVVRYRDLGDEDACLRLIKAFEGFLVRYYVLLRQGKVYINGRNIREFLKLYIKDTYIRKSIHQYGYKPKAKEALYETADILKDLLRPYRNEELMNEIYAAFLAVAKRYKSPDGKPRFHHYLLRVFHYQLARQIDKLISDPLVFKMSSHMSFGEIDLDSEETGLYFNLNMDKYVDKNRPINIEEHFDEINENWILGFTASEEYQSLSVLERKILKLYYVDEKSDQQIADELGTCRATINRKRNHIVRKLRKYFQKTNKISKDKKDEVE